MLRRWQNILVLTECPNILAPGVTRSTLASNDGNDFRLDRDVCTVYSEILPGLQVGEHVLVGLHQTLGTDSPMTTVFSTPALYASNECLRL